MTPTENTKENTIKEFRNGKSGGLDTIPNKLHK